MTVITNRTPETAWLRGLCAAEMGRIWARTLDFEEELENFINWRFRFDIDDWDRLFTSGDEQFQAVALEIFEAMMPGEFGSERAREHWHDWLNIDPAYEIEPGELRAFLDGVLETWILDEMDTR